jgi:hypothetical protein
MPSILRKSISLVKMFDMHIVTINISSAVTQMYTYSYDFFSSFYKISAEEFRVIASESLFIDQSTRGLQILLSTVIIRENRYF